MKALLLAGVLLTGSASAHQGHGSSLAWDVCEDASLGDECSFQPTDSELHRGSCRSVSDHLLCVRNRPIEEVREVSAAGHALGVLGTLAVFAFGLITWRLRGPHG